MKLLQKYRNSGVQQEIKDVFYLVVLQGLNYVAPLLVLPYLMIVLGAEKFGYIGFAQSVCTYLMILVDFGFNLSATKRIALAKENPEELNKIFSATVGAKVILLGISFFCFLLLLLVPQFEVYRSTMIIFFGIVIANAFSFFWLFQGLGKIRVISIINTVIKFLIYPLTFFLVRSSADFYIAAFLQTFVVVLTTLVTIVYIRYNQMASLVKVSFFQIKEELKESLPIFLSSAATSVYTASFVVVLGFFATASEVGHYSVADRLMRAVTLITFIPLSQAFYPKISRMAKENMEQAKQLLKKIVILIGGVELVIGMIFFFFSTSILDFLGKDYSSAEIILKVMSFIPVFIGVGGVFAQLGLLAMGTDQAKKFYSKTYFYAAIIALVSVLGLVYFYAANGAAIALFLTELFVCLMMMGGFMKFVQKQC